MMTSSAPFVTEQLNEFLNRVETDTQKSYERMQEILKEDSETGYARAAGYAMAILQGLQGDAKSTRICIVEPHLTTTTTTTY